MKCFCKGRVEGRECYGAMTRHHVIPRQRLRNHFGVARKANPPSFQTILADPRNIVWSCFGCHIGLIETGNPKARVGESDLPQGFWGFVEEHGLHGKLPRHLSEAAA